MYNPNPQGAALEATGCAPHGNTHEEHPWCFVSIQCESSESSIGYPLPRRDCDTSVDNGIIPVALDVGPTPKIASSLKLNATLIIDLNDEDGPKVLSCGIGVVDIGGNYCKTLIVRPSTRASWMPTEITVDEENALVLVGDSENLEIHAFDFEGAMVHSIDAPSIVTSLAFKPGVFAPLSNLTLTTASPTTTSPITFAATGFNDRFGKPLATDVDFSNFAIKATGDISSSSSESNVVITKTISGTVSQGGGGEVTFTVDVPDAGEWEFSLVDVFNGEYVRERSDCKGCLLLLPAAAPHNAALSCAPDPSFCARFSLAGTRSTSAALPTHTSSRRGPRTRTPACSTSTRASRPARSSAS